MAKPFAKEAILLQFLFNHVTQSVTEVIASNEELSCFLMKSAGEVLRKIQKENFRADYLRQSLDLMGKIQIASIQHVDKLLSIRINDWRLARLPDLYANFVSQIDLLTEDGLTLPEIKHLVISMTIMFSSKVINSPLVTGGIRVFPTPFSPVRALLTVPNAITT